MQIPDYLVTRLTSVDFQVCRRPRRGKIFEKIFWFFPNPIFSNSSSKFRKDWYRIEISHWKAMRIDGREPRSGERSTLVSHLIRSSVDQMSGERYSTTPRNGNPVIGNQS